MPDPDDTAGTDPPDADASSPDADEPSTTDTDASVSSGDDGADAGSAESTDPVDDADGADEADGPTEGPSGREVVVPARLYKTVTVMSTLLAMVSVVGGFVALDAATNRASASAGEIDTPVALLGLGLIVGGAAVYAFGTRFRAADLGDDEDAAGEDDPDTSAGTGD